MLSPDTKPLSAPPLARPGKPAPLPEASVEDVSSGRDFSDLRGRLILAAILVVSTEIRLALAG